MGEANENPVGKPTLESVRLRLRAVRDGDVASLVALDADPEVRRYVDMPAAPSEAQIRDELLPRWREYDVKTPRVGFWIAEVGGEFVGWFHLRPPKHVAEQVACEGDQEVGFRLIRSAWGKGLATEGAKLLIAYAFETVGAARVTAACIKANRASSRVMEKVGMKRLCERAYKPGMAAVVYAITREDAEKPAASIVSRVSQPVRIAVGGDVGGAVGGSAGEKGGSR